MYQNPVAVTEISPDVKPVPKDCMYSHQLILSGVCFRDASGEFIATVPITTPLMYTHQYFLQALCSLIQHLK